jgi:MFS family permease
MASSSHAPKTQAQESSAFSWNAFISTYLPALVLALGIGIALPSIPSLARSFHVSFGVASYVVTAFLIGNLVGTIPTGWLIDRFGRRRIMLAGPILTSAMAFAVVFAHTFPELVIFRFIDGFAAQMWLMGRLAGISYGAAANQRGRQVTWMFGMDSTGRLAGPLVGGLIATYLGLRAPFAAYGVLALLALIPGFFFIQEVPHGRRLAANGASATVRKLSIKEIVLPRMVYFGVALFAAMARGPMSADLMNLYAAFRYHLSPAAIGFMASGASCISLPMTFLSGWGLDHWGRKRLMVPGFFGLGVVVMGMAVSAALGLSFPIYLTLFLLGVFSLGFTSGSIQTVGADVAPPEARGMFLGLWRFAGQTGTAGSPILFALLADHSGYPSSFIMVAISAMIVGYLVLFRVPESGRDPLQVVQESVPAESLVPAEPASLGTEAGS